MSARTRLARGDRGWSSSTLKKLLLSLIVVGLLGSVTYKRTDALLQGDTQHRGSSVASATLTAGDTVYTNASTFPATSLTGGTPCKSEAAASKDNYNGACDTLKWDPSTGLRFPGQVVYAFVSIKNSGSIDARNLQLSIPTCTSAWTSGLPSYVPASIGAGGDPCAAGLDMYVQEVSSFTGGTLTNTQCVFPEDVYSSPATDCSTVWQADTVGGLAGINCWDLGSTAAQATRYFVVGMRLDPSTSTNAIQGRTAIVTLAWHLQGGNYNYDVNGYPQHSACYNTPLYTGP